MEGDSDCDDTDALNDWYNKRRKLVHTINQAAALAATIILEDKQDQQSFSTQFSEARALSTPRNRTSRIMNMVRDETSQIVAITAMLSPWYISCVSNPRPLLDPTWLKTFRLRFRISYGALFPILL